MTDNGSCYKAFAFRKRLQRLGLKHIRTRPYTPKTNGKAERFIQTALREWAYAKAYPTSDDAPKSSSRGSTVQLASPARQPKIQTAHQPPRPHRGQPVEAPQLVAYFAASSGEIRTESCTT